MNKKIITVFCLVLSILLCSCSLEEKNDDEMYMYYINAEGNALVQEIVPKMGIEETLGKVLKPDKKIEKNVLIPAEVVLEKTTMNGKMLTLYFKSQYTEMKKSTEVLFRAAVVQTMTQLDDILFVSFYVGDSPLVDSDGNAIGWMQAEDFIQSLGYAAEAYLTTDLRLYMSTADGLQLTQVKKSNVKSGTNTSVEKLVVEQLKKNSGSGKATIPKNTKILNVSIKDGICYVSFDSKFATDNYDQSPEVTIYSIVNSIIENGNASKVQILIEGSTDNLYKGTVDLSRPLEWNANIVEEGQK